MKKELPDRARKTTPNKTDHGAKRASIAGYEKNAKLVAVGGGWGVPERGDVGEVERGDHGTEGFGFRL